MVGDSFALAMVSSSWDNLGSDLNDEKDEERFQTIYCMMRFEGFVDQRADQSAVT